ncbi:MAG: hypothetical protein MK212_14340 [Saprospiraceae bacterium]|nr:hypothetical protein [Saprospiraceae bacterium]
MNYLFLNKIFLLPLSFCLLLLACNRQNVSTPVATSQEAPNFGQIVPKIDDKAAFIYQDKQGNYWFSDRSTSLYKYDGQAITLFTKTDGLVDNLIIKVQEDREGKLYFDTPSGIAQFDGKSFKTLEVVQVGSNKNEWKSQPDDLWFSMGWNAKGVYRFDGESLYYLEFPKSPLEDDFYARHPNVSFSPYGVYEIYKDKKGRLWFGTSNMGIYRYDGQQIDWMHEEHLTTIPQGGNFGIRSIIEDKKGNFWICNNKYRYQIIGRKSSNRIVLPRVFYQRIDGIPLEETQYFLAMIADQNKDLWMVNMEGVWRYDGRELIPYTIEDSNVQPQSIAVDNEDGIWISTQEHGGYKLDGSIFKKIKL